MPRILHIEDDPKNRLLVRKLLQVAGHEVIDASSGLEGVRAAELEQPELVLVDINVPDLDGYEVILRLRGTAGLQQVPIVAITAEGDRDASLAVGADGFIRKPIDARGFAKLVGRFLGGHRETHEDLGGAHLRQRSQAIVERLERKVVELSEANRRLEDMARLRREFLRNVSHELATPMTPVVGYLRLLLGEELGPLTDLQRKCLGSVKASTERLRAVVDTLIDVSALESGRMHFYDCPYDFSEISACAVERTRNTFTDAGIQLTLDEVPRPLDACGDPDKLQQAMVHVLDNAAKFTPPGGEVAVAVRSAGSGFLEFQVADSGPGIPKEHLEKVLEPFYQADGSVTRSHGGVGLGLAFARQVTEVMGGTVHVESPPSEPVAGRRLGGTLVSLRVQRGLRQPDPRLRPTDP